MSHTTALKSVQMTDKNIILKVAEKLKLKFLGEREFTMYDRTKQYGMGFQLDGWSQPLVIDTKTGNAAYDNYNGSWGAQDELDKMVQEYAAESNRQQGALAGYYLQENYLPNGDLVQEFETIG